ncbi:MAG TPA: KH domain-containing protein [Acidimicrobiales bacterium]|jgi:hypothetical protein|nr:KH domain-containing protein [Acidimicrobiales bacterium]
MTDLYEAGDINQTSGGGSGAGAAGADDEYDDEIDGDGDAGEGNEGNQVTAVDGGTSLSVLTYLAKALSNEPESVEIETEERRNGLRLNLHVAPEDMGRVIGRRGRTAQAIRTLVNVAGVKDGVQASVDIVDD